MKAVYAVSLAFLSVTAWAIADGAPAKRLNVLLLISDDCRAVQSCYGAPAQTLRIDQLAQRGLRFDL